MKDIIILEINGKKNALGNIEINTPSEFMFLQETTEAIVNSRIFDDFVSDMFGFITEEIQLDFDEKIDNVYITFIGNDDVFICSVVLDKINKRRGTYRVGITDWQASGYKFKYATEDEINEN